MVPFETPWLFNMERNFFIAHPLLSNSSSSTIPLSRLLINHIDRSKFAPKQHYYEKNICFQNEESLLNFHLLRSTKLLNSVSGNCRFGWVFRINLWSQSCFLRIIEFWVRFGDWWFFFILLGRKNFLFHFPWKFYLGKNCGNLS